MVEPIHPLGGGEFQTPVRPPAPAPVDEFGLVETALMLSAKALSTLPTEGSIAAWARRPVSWMASYWLIGGPARQEPSRLRHALGHGAGLPATTQPWVEPVLPSRPPFAHFPPK